MKQYLKEKISDNQLDLKTTIILNKAIRTFKPYEAMPAKEHGLTPTQFSVLETLYSKGKLRIQDLIEKMLATSGNMTVVIRNMVRDGWISRTCDPKDRRSFFLKLTPAGRRKIEEVLPNHIDSIVEAFRILEDGEKEDLIRILKKFKDM